MFRVIEWLVEALGWLRIMASPFLAGLAIGVVVYLNQPSRTTLWIGLVVSFVGLVGGIVMATRIRRKTGVWHFLSRLMASEEVKEKSE